MENPTVNRAPKHPKKTDRKYEKTEQDGQKPKKDRKANKFQYPENWKEELEATVTVETKIPALPKDSELLVRPDFDALRNAQTDFAKKIEKHFAQVDKLKEEQKVIREEIYKKNTSVFAELKTKKAERQVLSDALKANKEQKEELISKSKQIDETLGKMSKKAIGGKIMPKEKIEELIRQKEDAYRNSKHTATEEKVYIEEMNELKKNLPMLNETQSMRKEKEAIDQKLKVIRSEGKVLFDKVQVVSGAIQDIKANLDLQESEKAKEEPKAEDKPKEKPKRELTEPEKQIRAKIDKIFEEINVLKEKKKLLSKKFDEDNLAYDQQQFEVRKIGKMTQIQKKLKYEENKKKRAEEEEKLKALEADKAKELLQFKYREEIETCENLIRILENLKPSNRVPEMDLVQIPAEYKVDDKMLKDEGLVLMKSKKNLEEEGVKPGQKKLNNKKKEKKVPEQKDDGKLQLDINSLQIFHDMKVMPPTLLTQVDGVIGLLEEKKNYYLKLREEEQANGAQEKKETNEEEKEGEKEKENVGKQERKNQPEKNKTKVQMNEADFPSLN
jgi:hypothetical protein